MSNIDGDPELDPEESLFNTRSEVDVTLGDRLFTAVDRNLVTPVRIIWNSWRGRIGGIILLTYLIMGTAGVVLIDPPNYAQLERSLLPFTKLESLAILGSDNSGRSLLALMVHATPPMLKMVGSGAVFATGVAAIVGVTSGYKGGLVDRAMMTVTDIAMSIPGLPLVIVLAAVTGATDPITMGILLSINAWAGLARALRSQVLSIRQDSYVEASRVLGFPLWDIGINDITPNVMPYITVQFMLAARRVIFGAVGLYFLGVLPYSSKNWGTVLNAAYKSGRIYTVEAYQFWVPLMTILLFSLSLILLAQSMDSLFNPRLRAKHAATIAEADAEEEGGEGGVDVTGAEV